MIYNKIKNWFEKFAESWTACFFIMVQGDVTALTINHAITAGKTGFIAATVVALTPFKKDILNLWLLGIATASADYLVHPTNFGPNYAEAVLTGLGAVGIALIYERFKGKQ